MQMYREKAKQHGLKMYKLRELASSKRVETRVAFELWNARRWNRR